MMGFGNAGQCMRPKRGTFLSTRQLIASGWDEARYALCLRMRILKFGCMRWKRRLRKIRRMEFVRCALWEFLARRIRELWITFAHCEQSRTEKACGCMRM